MRPTIHELWVPGGLGNHPSRPMASISYITIHTTGNHNPTATAEAHARFQFSGGGGRQASWHYTVDADEIWQSFKNEQMCWHTGTRIGNENSIGIEICVNRREGFRAACERAAGLTVYLMKEYGLGLGEVVQHHHWSRKNCPAELRAGNWGLGWVDFLNMVQGRCGDAPADAVVRALQDAGVRFDEAHWRGVFEGRIRANKEWTRILAGRVIDERWGYLDEGVIREALMVLLGRG